MTSETTKQYPSQLDKFKEAARDIGCDDDEKQFADKLGRLAKQKTVGEKPK